MPTKMKLGSRGLEADQLVKSLPQTRLHFQNIVAGFTADDEKHFIDWREDLTPHVPDPPDHDPTIARTKISTLGGAEQLKLKSAKGKERASIGEAGGSDT